MTPLPRRVALITGCGKPIGIGSASARMLAAAGMAVVVSDMAPRGVVNDNETSADTDPSWKGLESLVEEILASGGMASFTFGDVSKADDVQSMVQAAIEQFGRLDVLVNNAAAPHGADRGEIEDVSLEAWERVMAVNATGTFLMCRAAIPVMRAQKWGRIINISSAGARIGVPRRAAYAASKAAIIGLTKSLAVDLAPFGITVNAICPGSITTTRARSSTRLSGRSDVDAGMAERAKTIPMQRHGSVEEIAAVVAFLASEANAYLTGQDILVDGGGLPRSN
jgi:3-oxoacyl-[acyl-carrier protein] reductase